MNDRHIDVSSIVFHRIPDAAAEKTLKDPSVICHLSLEMPSLYSNEFSKSESCRLAGEYIYLFCRRLMHNSFFNSINKMREASHCSLVHNTLL